jgi:hypothetical protein
LDHLIIAGGALRQFSERHWQTSLEGIAGGSAINANETQRSAAHSERLTHSMTILATKTGGHGSANQQPCSFVSKSATFTDSAFT